MFKNKVLVKAAPSAPSSSTAFFLLPLSLSPSTAHPPLSLQLELLSWKLSRQCRLACILHPPSQLLLLYKKCQSDAVDRVVSEFLKFDPSIRIGTEEEVTSGSLIAKATEIGLRCLMLDHKWTCIGDNTFVNSAFSTDKERSNVYAVNVQVQSGASDDFIFLVSPETFRFSRHQISDLTSSKNMDKFENKKEVILENFMACTTLPSLLEGYVVGISKEQSLINNSVATFSWEKVAHNQPQCIISTDFCSKDPLLALDFHTPKPDIRYSTGKKMEREKENFWSNVSDSGSKDALSTMNEVQLNLNNLAAVKSISLGKGQTPLLVPSFTKITRKTAISSSAPIRSKGDDAQVKSIQVKCQIIAKSQKNETVLVSSSTECPLETQTSAGAVHANKHAKPTQRTSSVGVQKSIKSRKKNDAAPEDKFTAETGVDATAKKSQNKKKSEGGEGLEAGRRIQSSDKTGSTTESGADLQEKDSVAPGSNCQDSIKAVPQTDGPIKKIQSQKKSEEFTETKPKAKAKTKQILDKDEVTTKVLNSHKRGQLQSLTIADLKCFLSCKKAKVGGPKEELIRRVAGFLD